MNKPPTQRDNERIEALKKIADDTSKPIEERRKAWKEFNRLTNPHYAR